MPTTTIYKNKPEKHDIYEDDFDSDGPTKPGSEGGWGWLVCLAAFVSNVVVDGTIFSFGVVFSELVRAFGGSKCETALVGSVMVGTHLFVGPISSTLINRYGVRVVTIVGSVLMCLSFVLSSMAPSLMVLTLTYGLIGGVGLGFVYISSILAVGFYFDKRRALANGIAASGSGFGLFLYAPLCIYLQESYTWRGALFILAAINLNCAVCGALMQPLTRNTIPEIAITVSAPPTSGEDDNQPSENTHGRESKELPHVRLLLNDDPYDFNDNSNGKHEERWRSTPTLHQHRNGNQGLLSKLMTGTSHTALDNKRLHSGSSHMQIQSKCLYTGSTEKMKYSQRRLEHIFPMNSEGGITTEMTKIDECLHKTEPVNVGERTCLVFQFAKKVLPMRWIMKLPYERRLLYVLFMASSVLWPTQNSVLTILPDYVELKGYSRESAASMISIVGLTNTIGRIIAGLAADRPRIRAIWLNAGALFVGGAMCIAFAVTDDLVLLMCESGVFGLCMATWCSLRPIVLVDLLGIGHLTNALGTLVLFQGISFYVGPPIAGYLYDNTLSYQFPFLLSAASLIVSGVIATIIDCLDTSYEIS